MYNCWCLEQCSVFADAFRKFKKNVWRVKSLNFFYKPDAFPQRPSRPQFRECNCCAKSTVTGGLTLSNTNRWRILVVELLKCFTCLYSVPIDFRLDTFLGTATILGIRLRVDLQESSQLVRS